MAKDSIGPRRRTRILFNLGIPCVILVSALLVAFFYMYSGSSRDIEVVANKLQPEAAWSIVGEQIYPPKFVCSPGVSCPSVFRSWSTDKTIDLSQFKLLLSKAGWGSFVIDGDCSLQKGVYGASTVCETYGTDGKYNIHIYIQGNYHNDRDSKITIFVDSRKER